MKTRKGVFWYPSARPRAFARFAQWLIRPWPWKVENRYRWYSITIQELCSSELACLIDWLTCNKAAMRKNVTVHTVSNCCNHYWFPKLLHSSFLFHYSGVCASVDDMHPYGAFWFIFKSTVFLNYSCCCSLNRLSQYNLVIVTVNHYHRHDCRRQLWQAIIFVCCYRTNSMALSCTGEQKLAILSHLFPCRQLLPKGLPHSSSMDNKKAKFDSLFFVADR